MNLITSVLPKYFLPQIIFIFFEDSNNCLTSSSTIWCIYSFYLFQNKHISTSNIWQSTHHCVLHLSIFAIKSSYQTNLDLTSLFESGWKLGLILFDHIAHLLKWNTHHPWNKNCHLVARNYSCRKLDLTTACVITNADGDSYAPPFDT